MVAKRKRKLTLKQKLAGFGGRRVMELAKPGSAKRRPSSVSRVKSKARKSYVSKRKTAKKSSSKSKSSRPSWVTPAIYAAVAAAAAVLGLTANSYVKRRGGWAKLKSSYTTGGIGGAFDFLTADPIAPPLPVLPPVVIEPVYKALPYGSVGTIFAPASTWSGLVPEVKELGGKVVDWFTGGSSSPAAPVIPLYDADGYSANTDSFLNPVVDIPAGQVMGAEGMGVFPEDAWWGGWG